MFNKISLVSSCVIALTLSAHAQETSTYVMEVEEVDFSNFDSLKGGTVTVPFKASSQQDLSEIGASFDAIWTFSALSDGNQWELTSKGFPFARFTIGVADTWTAGKATEVTGSWSVSGIPIIPGYSATEDLHSMEDNSSMGARIWDLTSSTKTGASNEIQGDYTATWNLVEGSTETASGAYRYNTALGRGGSRKSNVTYTASAAPEPSSTLLLMLSSVCLLRRKR